MSDENRFHKQSWKLRSETIYRETITKRNGNEHHTQLSPETNQTKDQAKNISLKLRLHLSPFPEGTLLSCDWSMGWIPGTSDLSAHAGMELGEVPVVFHTVAAPCAYGTCAPWVSLQLWLTVPSQAMSCQGFWPRSHSFLVTEQLPALRTAFPIITTLRDLALKFPAGNMRLLPTTDSPPTPWEGFKAMVHAHSKPILLSGWTNPCPWLLHATFPAGFATEWWGVW